MVTLVYVMLTRECMPIGLRGKRIEGDIYILSEYDVTLEATYKAFVPVVEYFNSVSKVNLFLY